MSDPAPLESPASARAPAKPAREAGRKDPALLFAHAAMGAMLEHGVSPTPSNYLIWFSYHSDSTPGLRPAMEARLGGPVTQEWLDELYGQFFAVEREAHSLQQVAARLEGAVNEAICLIQDAREDALRYGGTLDQASTRLAAEPQSLSLLLRRLVAETQEVSRRTEAAARKLNETSSKTREMQGELAKARRLACTDPLTGLANRRQLDEALREALAAQRPACLVMVDVDHFKAVNDTHGHAVGDQVLRQLATVLEEAGGESALAARFGGEEFALLLRLGQIREAVALAEHVRKRIGQSVVSVGQTGQRLSVTASLGVAMASPGETPAQLIERADAALYEAKRGGRNRVCTHAVRPKAESLWS